MHVSDCLIRDFGLVNPFQLTRPEPNLLFFPNYAFYAQWQLVPSIENYDFILAVVNMLHEAKSVLLGI